jgi:hypothetical protein
MLVLSLLATSQGVALTAIGHTLLHLGHHFKYLTVSANNKALVRGSGPLQKAKLGATHALVYQALHLKYLFLLHAFSPSIGLPNFS